MRDLLYLSESKMNALVPQLPVKVLRRLGFDVGLNAGLVSVRATLPAEQQSSMVAMLDPVIEMIEAQRSPRWRTDPALRVGDWIQFEEELCYGEALTSPYEEARQRHARNWPPSPALGGRLRPDGREDSSVPSRPSASDLVYFLGGKPSSSMFVLCGSRVHLRDKRQGETKRHDGWAGFYTTAVLDYTQRLAVMPDEAAVADPPALSGNRGIRGYPHADAEHVRDDLRYGIAQLYNSDVRWAGRAELSGHARVLALDESFVLATPLYVEYTHH